MNILTTHDLKGSPPKVFIDTEKEIKLLNLNYLSLTTVFNKLKVKMFNNKNNKIEVDNLAKIRLLLSNFDGVINNIEDILVSLDQEGYWKLTNEDIERINCSRESNLLFNTFLPYMLTYKLINDTLEPQNNSEILTNENSSNTHMD
jgi:hypothetical protein